MICKVDIRHFGYKEGMKYFSIRINLKYHELYIVDIKYHWLYISMGCYWLHIVGVRYF